MNINRDYLIILDVKKGTVSSPNIYFFNTDKNTSNLYVQMVIRETSVEATTIENATDYSIKANVIKPDLDFHILDGILVNEEKAIYEFNLTEECINLSGNCKIEFEVFSKVNNIEESITSFSTKFKVFPSILTDTNKPTESSSDYPILKQLIEEVRELQANGGGSGNTGGIVDLSNYQKKTDDTLKTTDKTIIGAINELYDKIVAIIGGETNGIVSSSYDDATGNLVLTATNGSTITYNETTGNLSISNSSTTYDSATGNLNIQ